MIVKINNDDSGKELFADFLKQFEYLLPDPLSHHVDINGYAQKLLNKGVVYAFCEKTTLLINGIAAGYMNDEVNKTAYLQVLLVNNNMQGKGIGSSLINLFEWDAKNRGMERVQLTCDKSNEVAYSFYERRGYKKSTIKHYNLSKQILEHDIT